MTGARTNEAIVGKEDQPVGLAKLRNTVIKGPVRILGVCSKRDRAGLIVTDAPASAALRAYDFHHWRLAVDNIIKNRIAVGCLALVVDGSNLNF